ncbi:uncharacterized protein TNCV_3274121 [Trichonephila clavipes]|nr:uncharacterized protein TNCV_3274121 [Trichonephila clavipes]
MLTAVSLGLGSNPGEDMDVCKRIVPSQHGGTLNSCRSASSLVRLVEGEERWEDPDHPQGVLPQNWGETELNRSVTFPLHGGSSVVSGFELAIRGADQDFVTVTTRLSKPWTRLKKFSLI